MIVAGLDIATMTGVCLGEPGQTPRFYSRDLGAGKSHDHRWGEALRLAQHLIAKEGVGAIGIEAPIIVPKRDKKANNLLLMGFVANVRGWASIKGVPCAIFETQTIDSGFLGFVPKGRDNRKAAILKQCRLFGWNPKTEDEADAGAVFEIMCGRMSKSYAAKSGTLLRGRV